MHFSLQNMQCHMTVLCLTFVNAQSTSFLSWVWSKSSDNSDIGDVDHLSLISIPYETTIEDDKFLQEASKLTDIQLSSALEICQHKIVLKLKKSCGSMTEEDLGKLSVGLLNCQSAVEGRRIYSCTEDMSLKQCTINMDSDIWNAYHLMSNRARAICYSIRNVQFRALSELAINKLARSAQSQIDSLKLITKSHDNLKDTTAELLSMIEEKNQILMEEQKFFKKAQLTAYRHIQEHLRDLYNERFLIRGSHAHLTAMFDDIERKIESTGQHFTERFFEIQKSHEELLNSLTILLQQSIEKLKKINNTIYTIEIMSNTIRQEIDAMMGWLNLYFGSFDSQFMKCVYIFFHIFYLLGAMLIAAFLNVPFFVRLLIITLIPLNMMIFMKNGVGTDLDFTLITLLLFLSTIAYYVLSYICHSMVFIIKKAKSKKVALNGTRVSYFLSFQQIKNVLVLLATNLKIIIYYITKQMTGIVSPLKNIQSFISINKYDKDLNEHPSIISEDNDENKCMNLENSSEDEYFEHVGCRLRQQTPDIFLSECKSSKSTKASSQFCLANKKFGGKCQSHIRFSQLYCDRHK